MHSFLLGLRQECRALLEHVLIVLVVLCLPGSLYVRGLGLLSRWHRYFVDLRPAAMKLQAAFPLRFSHEQALRALALHRLVDMADFYLSMLKGDRWFAREVRVSGDALVPVSSGGPAPMLFTFHYGQGFWALRYFRDSGVPCSVLHLIPPKGAPWGERFSSWIGRRRSLQIGRLAGGVGIAPGGAMTRMRESLHQLRVGIVVMPDVPPPPEMATLEVDLLGISAKLPAGAITLAVEERVPVYIYTMVLCRQSGKRQFRIQGPFHEGTPQKLAMRLAGVLGPALADDPAAWHLWAWVDTFLVSPMSSPDV